MPEMRISLCGRRILLASQLMAHDALGAHATYELGISENFRARSIQAASASAASFAVGATLPLLVTALVPPGALIPFVSGTSLVFPAPLGGLAARAGGAGVGLRSRWRRPRVWGRCPEQSCEQSQPEE